MLEGIVGSAALLADGDCTRDDRRLIGVELKVASLVLKVAPKVAINIATKFMWKGQSLW